jgi:prophage DNA circulation protein
MSLTEWKISDGSFKGFSFHTAKPNKNVNFGAISQDVTVERRIQITERALLDGADVEDFGKKARTFSVDVLFFGGDYQDRVDAFDKVLNEGTTGKLILPDLSEAVFAKFTKYGRKTTSTDGGVTVLNVNFIEDRTTKSSVGINVDNLKLADAQLEKGSTPQDIASKSNLNASDLLNKVRNNEYLKKIENQRTAINSVSATINQQVSAIKQTIFTVTEARSALALSVSNLKASINAALSFLDSLKPTNTSSGSAALTAYTSDLVAADFTESTSLVKTQTVTDEPEPTFNKDFSSTADTIKGLTAALNDLVASNASLESATNGKTKDVSAANVSLINSVRELIDSIDSQSATSYLTQADTSLLEVMFRNGLTVDQVQRIYKLNTHIVDPFNIPALTVVYL